MLIPLAAAATAFAAFFAVYAFTGDRRNRTAERLGEIAGDGAALVRAIDEETDGVWDRIVHPMAAGATARVADLLPARMSERFEGKLAAAGGPMRPGTFSTVMVGLAVGLIVLVAAAGIGSGSPMGKVAGLALMAGAFGAGAPVLWLSGQVARRQLKITRSLPDTFDLLVVSVEAGLSLEAAMARVVDNTDGPLSEEFRRALAEMNLGLGRRRALLGIVTRIQLPVMRTLISAILQADQTGMGIAPVLRSQSDFLRIQRRQHAEERAMKAPLKMMFPLVFFIFPSLFVVLLGPAMISLMRTLGGG